MPPKRLLELRPVAVALDLLLCLGSGGRPKSHGPDARRGSTEAVVGRLGGLALLLSSSNTPGVDGWLGAAVVLAVVAGWRLVPPGSPNYMGSRLLL